MVKTCKKRIKKRTTKQKRRHGAKTANGEWRKKQCGKEREGAIGRREREKENKARETRRWREEVAKKTKRKTRRECDLGEEKEKEKGKREK